MDTSNLLKPTTIGYNSIFKRIKKFLGAALLADFVLGNAINVFVQNLNRKGLLGLGSDFHAYQMIWGDSIWLNIIHLIILFLTAAIFGFIFGYLSRRISLSEKIIFTFCYVFIRFIFLAVFSTIIEFFIPSVASTWNKLIGSTIYIISSSEFNATFVILGYVIMFASAFYFIDKGCSVINDPYYTIDKSKTGTLFNIKWYHYFWLFIPISVYSQILLNLLYKIGYTIVTLICNFKWYTIFGGTNGEKGNAIDIAWESLFLILIVTIIVLFLMDYLRRVLAGETSQNWSVKVLISLGIGIIIPFLTLYFTSLAG